MLELEDRLRSLVDTRAPTITLEEVYSRRPTTTSRGTRRARTRRSATPAFVAVCAIAIAITAAVITRDHGTGPKIVAGGQPPTGSATVAQAKPLSEQQWGKQVNSVCKQVDKHLDEILVQNGGYPAQPDDEKRAATVEQIVPVLEQALTSIHALEEPKALKKEAKKLAAGLSDTLATLHADPSVFNVVAVFESSVFDDRRSRSLGLKACTSTPVRRIAGLER